MKRLLLVIGLAGCAHGRSAAPENRLDCAGPHTLADSANGRIQGAVTHAATDEPLADLEIVVNSRGVRRDAVTDDRGRWLIGDLPEGEYVVIVQRDARVLYSTVVHVCAEDVLTMRTPIWRP